MKGGRVERGQGQGTSGLRVRNGRPWALFFPCQSYGRLMKHSQDAHVPNIRIVTLPLVSLTILGWHTRGHAAKKQVYGRVIHG